MGTRGAMGFRSNNTDKVTYNHFDSYPEGLGVQVMKFIRDGLTSSPTFIQDLKKSVDSVKLVNEDDKVPAKELKRLMSLGTVNTLVGGSIGSIHSKAKSEPVTYYQALRESQGDLEIGRAHV